MDSPIYNRPSATLSECAAVIACAVLLHAAVLAAYAWRPQGPEVQINELSVSFASQQQTEAQVVPQPKAALPAPPPRPVEQGAAAQEVLPSQQEAAPTAPVALDAEPDYRAEYLNNPRPPYPAMATRMGYQGKVVLDVEVLSDGQAGEVSVFQSSGYAILDRAALQTVKTWRFVPARRLGQVVAQRIKVPINYRLQDNEI